MAEPNAHFRAEAARFPEEVRASLVAVRMNIERLRGDMRQLHAKTVIWIVRPPALLSSGRTLAA